MRARALRASGADFAAYQGDYDRAEALCQESLFLSRELEDIRGIADSRFYPKPGVAKKREKLLL